MLVVSISNYATFVQGKTLIDERGSFLTKYFVFAVYLPIKS